MHRSLLGLVAAAAAAFAHPLMASPSFYPLRPDDPQAVYVTPDRFPVHADGQGDDSAALQQAIDRVQETTRRGIVFVPEGRYRLSRTLLVWSGIRLIGYGARRPVFVLAPRTPGFQEGEGRYLVHFVSDRPQPGQPVRDANPGTFYSAMSNIDVEIGAGNPAAVGVRSHYAQHGYLAHMDFHIGEGRAGVEEVGNESEDLRFFGGEFGITTHKPSPSWPFVLLDSHFEGQRRAAIETEEGGLTLVRVQVRDVPTAVLVREHRAEELWVRDSRFERISGPALVISDEHSARTQINLQNTVCVDVPVLARFRESGRVVAGPAPLYRVKEFCHGLQLASPGAAGTVRTTSELEPLDAAPAAVPSDIPALPAMETWANLRSLGARGDGVADDTAVLRAAIAQHRAIYLPGGHYRVTEPIVLRPDTVLIGLNPTTTRILITDFTAAFQGVNGPTGRPQPPDVPAAWRSFFSRPPFPGRGAPVPMLEAPRGGTNIVTGLGLDTGGVNNRAVALKWCAGATSMLNDVRFLGGHGTYGADGDWLAIYNDTRSGDPDPQRRWDSQYWSLWVTDGGGGTFKDIWTPSPFAAAGLYVSDTSTPGRVYALSSEHHVRNEVKLRRVANWQFYALQTEEERGESPRALPLEIEDCHDLLVANFFIYRVDLGVPFETGIRVTNSSRLSFRGLHAYSPGKLTFDHTLVDATRGRRVREREVASLWLSDEPSPPRASGVPVQQVAGGFTHAEGAVAGPAGEVYFVDQAWGRIFRWSEDRRLSLVTDSIPEPVALALDHAGHLIVVSRHGNVYALTPGAGEAEIRVLAPGPVQPRPDAVVWLPANRWRDSHDWAAANTAAPAAHLMLPDGSGFIPAPESFLALSQPGHHRAGTIDLTRAYALISARPGESVYVSDEFGQKTWRMRVQPEGSATDLQLFAEEGEAGTAVDPEGNVYVCAGDVFVYRPDGSLRTVITVPERPSALAFGGPDGRTLYIAARTSLYSCQPTRRPK